MMKITTTTVVSVNLTRQTDTLRYNTLSQEPLRPFFMSSTLRKGAPDVRLESSVPVVVMPLYASKRSNQGLLNRLSIMIDVVRAIGKL